jgi:magnesium-transporting ATPase (P-type)
MTSELKGSLVKIVKNAMLFDPTICAIGEGTKDSEMMSAADISIELVSSVE